MQTYFKYSYNPDTVSSAWYWTFDDSEVQIYSDRNYSMHEIVPGI